MRPALFGCTVGSPSPWMINAGAATSGSARYGLHDFAQFAYARDGVPDIVDVRVLRYVLDEPGSVAAAEKVQERVHGDDRRRHACGIAAQLKRRRDREDAERVGPHFRRRQQGQHAAHRESPEDHAVGIRPHDGERAVHGVAPRVPLGLREIFGGGTMSFEPGAVYQEPLFEKVGAQRANLQRSGHITVNQHDASPDDPRNKQKRRSDLSGFALALERVPGVVLLEHRAVPVEEMPAHSQAYDLFGNRRRMFHDGRRLIRRFEFVGEHVQDILGPDAMKSGRGGSQMTRANVPAPALAQYPLPHG